MESESVDLNRLVEQVHDESTFIEFLRALGKDREDEVRKEKAQPSSPYGPGVNGWQNASVEDFLESAVAWADDSKEGLEHYPKPENAWRRCADIIFAGKFYE